GQNSPEHRSESVYMKIGRIGSAVRSLEGALKGYCQGFGLRTDHVEEVADQKARVATLPVGETRLELLEAMEEDSPVGKFIAGRGEGLHHICFRVENLEEELKKLKAAGVRLIDEMPSQSARDCLVDFMKPSSTGGVLVELSQSNSTK